MTRTLLTRILLTRTLLTRTLLTPSVLAVAAAVLVGCGVPLQDSPQALPPEVIPPPIVVPAQSPSPSPSPSPTVTEPPMASPTPIIEVVDLYFIREDGLVPLASDVPSPVDPQIVLDGLAAGPPAETGLRSVVVDPLTGSALVSFFAPTAETALPSADATIAVAPAFSSLPPAEQVLLLGQVVVSLSAAGYDTVSVVDEAGSPLAVPLPDGRLLDRPATALDYAGLVRTL